MLSYFAFPAALSVYTSREHRIKDANQEERGREEGAPHQPAMSTTGRTHSQPQGATAIKAPVK